MKICPVCRKKMENGRICTECGHDESRNVENYLSLVKISGEVKILSEEIETYQNKAAEARFYTLMENQMKGYESHIKSLENQLSQQKKRLDELEKEKSFVSQTTVGSDLSRRENLNDLVRTLGGSVDGTAQDSREKPKENWEKGSIVTFGHFGVSPSGIQDPIEWLVVERQGSKCLLLSRYGLGIQMYNDTFLHTTWEKSDIRSWLNDTFYKLAFNPQESQRIVTTALDKTFFSSGTNDHVFLLSKEEARLLSSEERKAEPTRYARNAGFKMEFSSKYGRWWLRDQGTRSIDAAFVDVNGGINETGIDVRTTGVMVRPAVWVEIW